MIELIAAHREPDGPTETTQSLSTDDTKFDDAPRRLSAAAEFSSSRDPTGSESDPTSASARDANAEEQVVLRPAAETKTTS